MRRGTAGRIHQLIVPDESRGRLDRMIAHLAPGLSRATARRAIAAGSVFVNGRRCRIASRLVQSGDVLSIASAPARPAPAALPVLYEDAALIAIDKPPGIPSVRTRVAASGTVLDALRNQLRRRDGRPIRLWAVHRLDAQASGVMVLAKTRAAAGALSRAFRERGVDKVYVALVRGAVAGDCGGIEQPLRRHGRKTVAGVGGQPARTDWRVVRRDAATTLLELRPHTGRMHQLRVHLSACGHPIVGDPLYGGPAASRLMLHALRIRLPHPDRQATVEIATPWPAALGSVP